MIRISNQSQRIIKLPGPPEMRIFFACDGECPISFVHILLKIINLLWEVTLLVRKRIFLLKIILPNPASVLVGSTLLKGNGYFINYGADYCTILQLLMLFSRQGLTDVMVKMETTY